MKAFVLFLAVLLSVADGYAKENVDEIWDRANTAYVNADYQKAIESYDSIVQAGYVGYKLFYNMGNAYFKDGKIGKSILNYERALQHKPSDPDVRYNLKIVNNYVKDKIEAVPEFFLVTWLRSWRMTMGSDAWAVASLAMFALSLGFVLLFLLGRIIKLRKIGFYGAILTLLIAVFAVAFSVSEKHALTESGEAIVMISAAPVKSSPDNASKDIFILHEGTKVSIVGELGDWREITIADGNKGWIIAESIETVALPE